MGRGRVISLVSVGLSCGLTAAMSLIFNHTIRLDMMVTGFVCAVVIDRLIKRITGQFRRRLARDVAERTRELQQANEALHEAARQSAALRDELMMRDRMATAGMLAAGVSHEIRSPLAVICIAVEEAREDLVAGHRAALEARLADIGDAGERIAVILRDLSSIARPVDDPVGPVDLGGVLDSACRLASYRFARNVTMERLPGDVGPVLGNASRLVQVVLNLVVNAARATDPARPNRIRIGAANEGDAIVVTITDTGTGMSPETQARLFEPFFTTGGKTGGTGLGLTISRAILERMGGSIAIASTLGVGTTVTLRLARYAQPLALAS